MILENEKYNIKICDICEDKSNIEEHVSLGTCLVCTREYCLRSKSDGYFDRGWLTYDLSHDKFPFCIECAKKLNNMNKEDWLKAGINVKGYSGRDEILKLSTKMLDDSKKEIKEKLTEIFRLAIGVSAEVYKDKIEKEKRKAEIEKEFKELEKKAAEKKQEMDSI